ncbi:MAG TPA: cobyrinate a,c-diamide synthase [Candidatus Binataceae bacterium]|nr:cobyrinate a,c-diamide synthase [Candidatus Binataceae bacterium]
MNQSLTIPRLLIGGTASGIGKTTVTVALAAALRRRGLRLAPFKCGPDYLDPTYHSRAAGVFSPNLDGWMMGREGVIGTFARACQGADLALIEGVMGLFDGAAPDTEIGSSAEVAKWLAAPVLLVVDASGLARTLAATVLGFQHFDAELHLAGVICNQVGSRGHLDLLRQVPTVAPVMGGLPRDPEHAFPERHLGLRTASRRAVAEELFAAWGELAAHWCDLDAIEMQARNAPALEWSDEAGLEPPATPRCRIGLARDDAFHFYYEDNLRQLRAAGAELVPFSPISDTHLPAVDGLYIGGGYPEVYGAALAANHTMRAEIARFAAAGGTIYAECGGLMYLCQEIVTLEGERYPMAGVIASRAIMRPQLQALGYVETITTLPSPLGPPGMVLRGHQFRYSELQPAPQLPCAYQARRRRGGTAFAEGYLIGNVLASYIHMHWARTPQIPRALVTHCLAHRARGEGA